MSFSDEMKSGICHMSLYGFLCATNGSQRPFVGHLRKIDHDRNDCGCYDCIMQYNVKQFIMHVL